MQDVVVAEIERHVTYALDARIVIARGVGEEHKVTALELGCRNRLALLDLRARRHLKIIVRARLERILQKGRTVEGIYAESAESVAVAVVISDRAVDILDAEKFCSVGNYAFDALVAAGRHVDGLAVIGIDVSQLVLVVYDVPIAYLADYRIQRRLLGLPEHGMVVFPPVEPPEPEPVFPPVEPPEPEPVFPPVEPSLSDESSVEPPLLPSSSVPPSVTMSPLPSEDASLLHAGRNAALMPITEESAIAESNLNFLFMLFLLFYAAHFRSRLNPLRCLSHNRA